MSKRPMCRTLIALLPGLSTWRNLKGAMERTHVEVDS